MFQKYELKPIHNRQKSFYGKATVTTANNKSVLTSYTTEVCYIDHSGNFHRLWDGYSVTTMNHINEYRQQNGLETLSKKEWLNIPVEHYNSITDLLIEYDRIA